jgi:hypothetical protein
MMSPKSYEGLGSETRAICGVIAVVSTGALLRGDHAPICAARAQGVQKSEIGADSCAFRVWVRRRWGEALRAGNSNEKNRCFCA